MAILDEAVWSCGCRTEIIDNTFVITSCENGRGCPIVQAVLEVTQEQGNPLTILED